MNFDVIVSIVIYKPDLLLLQQTINSIANTQLKLKIVICDNSPTPLQPSALQSPHDIDYSFMNKNIGYGKGHNQNIDKYSAQANYFLILNPDIFFDGDLIEQLLARMEKDSSIGLCIPKICHPGGDLQLINRRLPRPQDYLISFLSGKLGTDFFKTKTYNKYILKDLNKNKPFICPTISGCFMLFSNKAFTEMAGFDERYFLYLEDTDLSRRVSQKYKTVVFADLVAYHHWSRGAYRSPKLFFMFVFSLVRYFSKWGWFWDAHREQLNSQVQYYTPEAQNKSAQKKNYVFNHAQI
ncbi:glycosyltransferase family 2 protein [bacterium]|nr:glycosyltransferase family 2 protein [bacterium]